jgi:hypothetical protein
MSGDMLIIPSFNPHSHSNRTTKQLYLIDEEIKSLRVLIGFHSPWGLSGLKTCTPNHNFTLKVKEKRRLKKQKASMLVRCTGGRHCFTVLQTKI